ncbi:MAG: hypothetical protein LBH01_04080 [Verrucomicrobiales bacterium]|jgi:succinate dehydrogenase/fumarate reductase cytochrome b subunit (b558 family)|nr:hypothetical protein [Verrucomicrobiales bacterium]
MSATATSESSGDSCRCGCGARQHGSSGCHHHNLANCRNIRAPRRIHSLLALPLVLFVLLHLSILTLGWSVRDYDSAADWLLTLAEQFKLVEVALLLLIVAQAIVGFHLLQRSGLRYHAEHCREDRVLPYFLQRWSGAVILLFLLVHLPLVEWRLATATFAGARDALLMRQPLMAGFYALTILAVAWHVGNGIWTASALWGWRQSRVWPWLGLSVSAGLAILLAGAVALGAFVFERKGFP